MRRFPVDDLPEAFEVSEGGGGSPSTVTFGDPEAPTVVPVEVVTPDGGSAEVRLFPERSYRHQDLIKRLAREE